MPKSAPCLLSGIISVVWVKRVDVFVPTTRTDADPARNRRVPESVMANGRAAGDQGLAVYSILRCSIGSDGQIANGES